MFGMKSEGNRSLISPTRKWKGNIKSDLKKLVEEWIHLTQKSDQ